MEKQRRPWRFSVRWLLHLVLIVAIPCGWYADRLRKQRLEREAIAASLRQQEVVRYIFTQGWIGDTQPGVAPGAIPPKLPTYVTKQATPIDGWAITSRTQLPPDSVAPGKLDWQQLQIRGGWDGSGVRPMIVEISGFEGEPQFLPYLRSAFNNEGWKYSVSRVVE